MPDLFFCNSRLSLEVHPPRRLEYFSTRVSTQESLVEEFRQDFAGASDPGQLHPGQEHEPLPSNSTNRNLLAWPVKRCPYLPLVNSYHRLAQVTHYRRVMTDHHQAQPMLLA